MARGRKRKTTKAQTKSYDHKNAKSLLRPDVGLQAQFKQRRPSKKYRYDPSIDPELSWDINADRERAEVFIAEIERLTEQLSKATKPEKRESLLAQIRTAAYSLKRMSQPFLNWAGKTEKTEFKVPTLPLFIHERLSTRAILETLKKHKRDKQTTLSLFADEDLSITDRILKAYVHKSPWVNRMILGDSLVVMNSLLEYEGLGGQVQTIYIDPPYGVKFGSNFQPFIRKRDVKHSDDKSMTREPEMVQAYRDTWELGLHSYLTYLRDRFLLARELLHPSGSIFVQIGDENVHHVREVLDEVFGEENFCSLITFRTATSQPSNVISSVSDYILWYAKEVKNIKYHHLFRERLLMEKTATFNWIELPDGRNRKLTKAEASGQVAIPEGRLFKDADITQKLKPEEKPSTVQFQGKTYQLPYGLKYDDRIEEMIRLDRILPVGERLCGKRYENDNPLIKYTNLWEDTIMGTFALTKSPKRYVVETNPKVIARCILMTTDPGDLVLDPTCGSGTTAYVAEQWGRRWITIDTSRVPLALARQRLLTATFPYYELRDQSKGPASGFVYKRKQNKKGEEVGGIVPHITLKSIAQNQPPAEEVLVDRPEVDKGITRVSGPFVVEATIPTPIEIEKKKLSKVAEAGLESRDYISRMIEVLRRSPVLHLPDNQTVKFKRVRRPARAMDIHAEAEVIIPSLEDLAEEAAIQKSLDTQIGAPVAFYFGPEHGPVTEQMVFAAAREAYAKSFSHLYIIGFAIQDKATKFIQSCADAVGIPATYVQATMDIQMGDLLKTTRASQVFSVTGAPEIRFIRLKKKAEDGSDLYQVEILGLDVFDPVTMEVHHSQGDDVPAWFLDTDYNELAFCTSQAFFPRTKAWDGLKRALKGIYEDSVWEHLAGTLSEPFTAGENRRIAVKVIDDRGNELMVVKSLDDSEQER